MGYNVCLMDGFKDDNTLFSAGDKAKIDLAAPLAVKMRPRSLDEFVGQQHFLGTGKLLRRMLEADRLSSLILYGPPGSWKTSFAAVIANYSKATFHYLSAPAETARKYYEPKDQGYEKNIKSYLQKLQTLIQNSK